MDLFNQDREQNLLPHDGKAIYYGPVLSWKESRYYFERLLNTIEWQNDQLVLFGKQITTKREVAWYGEKNYSYTYSNATKEALIWTKELKELKQKVESVSGDQFNSCLLNLYHSGEEGMSWHSDDEQELGKNTTIASLSLGAQRKFTFKHKETKEKVEVILENGSLLVMKGTTQTHWLHALPKSQKVRQARINLTFRTILA